MCPCVFCLFVHYLCDPPALFTDFHLRAFLPSCISEALKKNLFETKSLKRTLAVPQFLSIVEDTAFKIQLYFYFLVLNWLLLFR